MSDEHSGDGQFDLGELMNKARDIQSNMQEAQQAAASVRVEGNAGGGMVVAEANGHGHILRITIEQSLFDTGDKAMIEDLTVAAINQAIQKGKDAMQQELSKATGGLSGLVDLSKIL